MNTNYIFPFGANNAFPDNGILSQAYDSRVSQNDILNVSSRLMHQGVPYEIEKRISGGDIYHWNPDFIAKLKDAFLNNVQPNMSTKEKDVFNRYITFAQDGELATTKQDVKDLDNYLGSL